MSLHVFVGLALISPVLLKLASTGWRFARYYTRSRAYRAQGPPQIAMRLLAPLFVAATVVLFGSGVAMGLLHGHALQIVRRLHGPAAVIWLALLGLHVLVYLGRALRALPRKPCRRSGDRSAGRPRGHTLWRRSSSAAWWSAAQRCLRNAAGSTYGATATSEGESGHRLSRQPGRRRFRLRRPSGRSSRRPAAPSPAPRSARVASSR